MIGLQQSLFVNVLHTEHSRRSVMGHEAAICLPFHHQTLSVQRNYLMTNGPTVPLRTMQTPVGTPDSVGELSPMA